MKAICERGLIRNRTWKAQGEHPQDAYNQADVHALSNSSLPKQRESLKEHPLANCLMQHLNLCLPLITHKTALATT